LPVILLRVISADPFDNTLTLFETFSNISPEPLLFISCDSDNQVNVISPEPFEVIIGLKFSESEVQSALPLFSNPLYEFE
jgi:hypothetical protein